MKYVKYQWKSECRSLAHSACKMDKEYCRTRHVPQARVGENWLIRVLATYQHCLHAMLYAKEAATKNWHCYFVQD